MQRTLGEVLISLVVLFLSAESLASFRCSGQLATWPLEAIASFLKFFKIYLKNVVIYFWLCQAFVAHRFSLVAVHRFLMQRHGLWGIWASVVAAGGFLG